MRLLTKEIIKKLPKLYETERIAPADKVAVAKFFHPVSDWTWYLIEFDGMDACWGLVSGHESEFGYFSLSEIGQLIGPMGLRVERDIYFKPTALKDLAAFGKGGVVY
jgi:hypothetical protein